MGRASLELRPLQPKSHAIRVGRDAPGIAVKALAGGIVEQRGVQTLDGPDHGFVMLRQRDGGRTPSHCLAPADCERTTAGGEPCKARPGQRFRVRCERQFDVARERFPAPAAETSSEVRAAAAEHGFDVHSTGDREMAEAAAGGAAHAQPRALGHQHRARLRERHAVDLGREARAVQCEERVAAEHQLGARQGDLERGGVGAIADQRVRDAMRDRVHRAAGDDAKMRKPGPPQVLDRGEHAWPQHSETHRKRCLCAMRSKSAAEIGLKETASPASSRLGGSRSGSNSASDVRPITFQPPGVANG